ncbi:MAG TPA: hypothetical protein VMH80_09635 [Bryobacteraceae bacterium]|nr:hypothetical protein [Bryobacteraceae bacterium]
MCRAWQFPRFEVNACRIPARTPAATACPARALGKPVLEPRKIEKWSIAHCNVGWDDHTSNSFYFGRSRSQMG